MTAPQTLFDKIWDAHVVCDEGDGLFLLHVDRHIVVDMNGNAFATLEKRGIGVHSPELTFATIDHSIVTDPNDPDRHSLDSPVVRELRAGTAQHGVRLFDIDTPGHGIVHVVAPELGLVLPGMTVAVGDSHTCTNGALGALAWGVGQGEVAHILATQTTRLRKPRTLRITLNGQIEPGVTAKDVILALIGKLGARAGEGYAIEYCGPLIASLPMEARLTLCNMTVELGARFGLIAPDDVTYRYIANKPFTPRGPQWDAAMAYWRGLSTDVGATFDTEIVLDMSDLAPQITWGNSLDAVMAIDGRVPDPAAAQNTMTRLEMQQWLHYMGLTPGEPIAGQPVHRIFLGSCTNSRISDLRAAAALIEGRKVADGVVAWAVPGSANVRNQAEAEGLDNVFREAGFEWRTPGCSICAGLNGEIAQPGERVVATSNRNFAGRQGPGSRTHIAGPLVAAASACLGVIADPRTLAA
jgi:3-isopropylmalate/(R)-2-methylmalate dehydratase large subunit